VKIERWLIAVNGKTESDYIQAIKRLYRLSAIEVKHFAKDPSKQLDDAVSFANCQTNKFSRVYVVFDRDDFDIEGVQKRIENLDKQASAKLKKPGCRWHAVVSSPCFELWYLLHFQYTDAAFSGETPCDNLRTRFSGSFQNYRKVDATSAKELVESKLQFACENATKLASSVSTSKTDMWRLVEALQTKAEKKK